MFYRVKRRFIELLWTMSVQRDSHPHMKYHSHLWSKPQQQFNIPNEAIKLQPNRQLRYFSEWMKIRIKIHLRLLDHLSARSETCERLRRFREFEFEFSSWVSIQFRSSCASMTSHRHNTTQRLSANVSIWSDFYGPIVANSQSIKKR